MNFAIKVDYEPYNRPRYCARIDWSRFDGLTFVGTPTGEYLANFRGWKQDVAYRRLRKQLIKLGHTIVDPDSSEYKLDELSRQIKNHVRTVLCNYDNPRNCLNVYNLDGEIIGEVYYHNNYYMLIDKGMTDDHAHPIKALGGRFVAELII